MDAVGLTDTGNMHGAIEFYKAAKDAGVKPVLGVDAYLAPRSRHEKDKDLDGKRSRIVLLAENEIGYKNLLAAVTQSWTEGFFERPRMDKGLLRERHEGIIAILPSFASDVSQCLRAGDKDGASAVLDEFLSIFGKDNLFLEITRHPNVEGHDALMQKVIALGQKSGVPLVAQHDVYYLSPEDREATEVMRRIKQGGRGRNEQEDFSFISEEEALALFADLPEAIENTGRIADRCNLSFTLGQWTFPSVPVSPGFASHDEELRATAYAGLTTRNLEKSPEVVERIDYELGIIIGKGFAVYYLIVADLLRYAKSAGILTTTRGSAAGSLVAYLVGITNVDPLFYKLPFERFLNPERPKAPDIDMDMADDRRDDMIAYTKQKYGEDHVAQIGTFGTMMARAAVRDVARALGHSYTTGDRIAKLIPIGSQGFPMTIDKALELEPDLKGIYDEDEDAREIIDLAKRIEGCVRHVGVHAAGVVVSPTPLVEWTPIQPDPKGSGKVITQYDMYSITDEYGGVGLLKFDFLGIKNLAILADAVKRVKVTRGIDIDIENVPIDDTKTFEMLARGETYGTFQLGGSGMTRWLKELRPTTIHDINAMVALYRPGPMETIPAYIARKRNPRLIDYPDPRIEPFLKESYGLLVYQDDLLYSAIHLAGYSWLEVDQFRKAIGKKIPAEMAKQKEKFTAGVIANGRNAAFADKMWELFEPFAAYGFNKCLIGSSRIWIHGGDGGTESRALCEVTPGTLVYALNEAGGTLVPRRVTALVDQGVRPTYQLTTNTHRVIGATDNHPFLVQSPGSRPRAHASSVPDAAWLELKDVKPGDRIAAPKPRIGIFIDGANQYFAERRALWQVDYARLRDALADYSDVRFIRYYTSLPNKNDPSRAGKERHIAAMERVAEVVTKPLKYLKNPEKPGDYLRKGDMDVDIALDALELAHADAYDIALVVSGDSDLLALSRRLVAQGKQIVFCGFRHNLAWELTRFSKYFYFEGIRQHIERIAKNDAPREGRAGTSAQASYTRPGVPSRPPVDTPGAHLLTLIYGEAPELLAPGSHAQWVRITTIASSGKREAVYDLSVEGDHSFVADGLIVHNSHAASYGKVAYQTAYMKANYPVEYVAALLTADAGDTEAIAALVAESVRMNIPVLPPDVNESGTDFTVAGGGTAVRFGLTSIKNFGDGVSHAILNEREAHGVYASLSDFLSRVGSKNLNRKSLESLIRCGALDSLAPDAGGRATLLTNIETMLAFHRDATTQAPQDSLFGSLGSPTLGLVPAEPVSLTDKLNWEKELLGMYVSGHPLDAHASLLAKAPLTLAKIKAEPQPGLPVILPVLVAEVRTILTKSGEKMAFIKFEDKTDSLEAVVFPKLYKEHSGAITAGSCLVIKANVSKRGGELSLAVEGLRVL